MSTTGKVGGERAQRLLEELAGAQREAEGRLQVARASGNEREVSVAQVYVLEALSEHRGALRMLEVMMQAPRR